MKHSELTGIIIGCAMKVHQYFKFGFQEIIYQRALAIELKDAGLSFKIEFEMPITYYDERIGTRKVDFLVEEMILVEIKAVSELESCHFAQALNYLEIADLECGLLINFGQPSLKFHRLTNKKYNKKDRI